MVLDYPNHNDFRRFRQALNRAYCAEDAFWRREYDPSAFQWLDCSHPELDACAILRQGSEAAVLAAFNFGDTELEDYTKDVVEAGKTVTVCFDQIMPLQSGQYLMSLGCTSYHLEELVIHHRLYDACFLEVFSMKDTVGFFDMNSTVTYE